MPDNVLGDVFEQLKDTTKAAGQQASPTKIIETVAKQITGQQLKTMKATDEATKQTQLSQIRQNLQTLMQPAKKPSEELPAYIKGKAGAATTIKDIEKQQEEWEKQKKKLQPLDLSLQAKKSTGEMKGGIGG